MGSRLELQILFEDLLGTQNVYFQAPPNTGMVYPCILYTLDDTDTKFADNRPYSRTSRYQVKYIDQNPDNTNQSKIAELPMCIFNRFYVANNLNHYVFNLYF